MEQLILHPECCKGCSYCVKNCPRQAVKLNGPINHGGYPTPVVDETKCVVCGICYDMCPDYVYEVVERSEKDETTDEGKRCHR